MPQNKLKMVYWSIALAFLGVLLPWSGVMLLLRPDFMLLVVIFWLIRAPNLCNVGTAWCAGLVMDLAMGGTFGQYALAYTITAFFAIVYQRRLVLFSSTQQAFYVFLLLIISQLVLLTLKTFSGAESLGWVYFLPSITGVLLWQFAVFFGMNTDGRTNSI